MKNSLGLAALVLAAAVMLIYSRTSPEPGATVAKDSPEKAESTVLSAHQVSASDVAAAGPKVPASSAPAAARSTSGVAAHKVFETPDLTRRLAEAQPVKIGEREWTVLGTRELSDATGKQTILVLRDEASGQLDYRQSALRFVLNQGVDYEAFISSRNNATRLFVNPLYGDIAVDAARIAAEYAALANDSQVARVMFIPLEVRPVPK